MGAVTEIGGATRKGADAAPPIGRWRSNASGSGSARSGRGLGLWGAWPARGYLNLEQRDLFTQSVRRRGVRAFVVCVRCRFFFFNTLFFGARVYAEGARPGWARRLSEPVFILSPPPRARPLRDFFTSRARGAVPFPTPLGRELAALPSGCVPAAPGGRRPGGSAASKDLPPPGTQPRAFSSPAGAPLPPRTAIAVMDERYLPELMAEKDSLDPSFTHTLRLVNQGEGCGGRLAAAPSFHPSALLEVSAETPGAEGRGGRTAWVCSLSCGCC